MIKQADKYLTQRDQNKQSRQQSRRPLSKNLVFQKSRNESMIFQNNSVSSSTLWAKKFPYDQETMSQMIQTLKQQNNHLKIISKMQQTQLNYYSQQQKQQLKYNNEESSTIKNTCQNIPKKQQLQIHRLKKEVNRLQEENQKIKKSIKCTSIKQLQTANQVYQEQIKALTAKVVAYQKSNKNIQEINKIIENFYFSQLKNKQLQTMIDEKNCQLEQSSRIIKKLKGIISQKNNEIDQIKQQKQKAQGSNKNKMTDDYVHRNQFMAKKKQIATLTETIQKQQSKIHQLQAKIQTNEQQHLQDLNKQINRKKQIVLEYQKLKKNYQTLQQTHDRMKRTDSLPVTTLKIAQFDPQIKKLKNPLVVKINDIKQGVQQLIYNLQSQQIKSQDAIKLIMNCDKRLKQQQNTIPIQNENVHENYELNIRQIMYCFELAPLVIQNFEHRQLIARYLIQNEIDAQKQYIDYDDTLMNISYVRSVFKKLLHQYLVFNKKESIEHCIYLEDIIKRSEPAIKANLNKMHPEIKNNNHSCTTGKVSNSVEQKCKGYKCSDYVEVLLKQNQLNEVTIQFIKFWTFKNKQDYFTFDQFISLFKVQDQCAFITQNYVASQMQQPTTTQPTIIIHEINGQKKQQELEIIPIPL